MDSEPRTQTLLEAARSYVKRGWSIVPVAAGQKRPGIAWKEYQNRRPTKEELIDWFGSHRNGDFSGLAVVLGPASGRVTGRDFDEQDAYTNWADDYPEYARILPTVRTGRGLHVYFRRPPESPIRGTVNLGDGELRADGGILVLPPSRHPSGKRYEWVIPLPHGELPEVDPYEIDLISETKLHKNTTTSSTIKDGTRNSTLTSIAGSLRRRGVSEEGLRAALNVENHSRCQPPLDDREVTGIARSVAKYPPATQSILVSEHRTEVGNARRLVALHGDDVRYVHLWKKWLVWDGRRWAIDDSGEVMRRAKQTVGEMYRAAADADPDQRESLGKWAHQSESEKRLTAMIHLAASEPGIPISSDDLDRDPWLLNCLSGTIHLKTGAEQPHDRNDLITKIVPTHYDLGAECPELECFLDRVLSGNNDLIGFVQRAIGYALTGVTREHCLFICYGTGRNGKSTLLELVADLLGDYARQTPIQSLMIKRGNSIPNDIARLRGARFITSIETEQGQRMQESLVKQLTGGDRMTARFLHGEFFEFVPQGKLFLGVNHKPEIRGTDNAIWERINLIPFTVFIPKSERDKTLPEKLRAELPGVLRWSVDGCLKWQRGGLGENGEVRGATEAYRREMDVLGSFMEDRCIVRENVRCPSGQLYKEYRDWCEATNEKPLRQKDFVARLEERGFERGKRSGVIWKGIGLLEEVGE